MRKSVGLVAFAGLALAGCASGFPGVRPLTYATPGEARVFATGERCVHEPTGREAAPLVAAFLTGAASQLIKNFGSALAEGAKGGPLPTSTATLNLQLEPGTAPRCLVVVRGSFQPTANAPAALNLADYLGVQAGTEFAQRLDGLSIPPLYRIDHYVEVRVASSANNRALTLAPTWVQVDHSLDGSTSGERDFTVTIMFNRVGGATPVGSTLLLADRRVRGGAVRYDPLPSGRYALEAPWFAGFHDAPATVAAAAAATGNAAALARTNTQAAAGAQQPPPQVIGAGGAGAGGAGGAISLPGAVQPGSSIANMHSRSKTAVPVTITATVVETRPTNQGLAFISSVFNGVQPKLEEQAKLLLDSNAARVAQVAAESADLTTQSAYQAALAAAMTARIAYCETSSTAGDAAGKTDRINKSKLLYDAQVKANDAALKADSDLPFDRFATISEKLPDTANPALCNS